MVIKNKIKSFENFVSKKKNDRVEERSFLRNFIER